MSNILLVAEKIYYVYSILSDSINYNNHFALSLTSQEPSSYNDFDPDYIINDKNKEN